MNTQDYADHMAGLMLGNGTQPISNWYVALIEGNYVPNGTERAADLPTTIGECTAYSEASRPAWNGVYDGTSTLDNLASKAQFTMTADKRIYGIAIVSSSVKGSGTGRMIAVERYDTPRDLTAGTVFSADFGQVLTKVV